MIKIKEGVCEDFGHDSIKKLEECKFAAGTLGKKFHCTSEPCMPMRNRRYQHGCLTYGHKAYYNEPFDQPLQRKRSKRSSKSKQKTTRKRKARNNRKYFPKPPSICYENKGM